MEGDGGNPPSVLALPAIKSKCTPKLSKELKIYKRPQQTITDIFGVSKSNVHAAVRSHDVPEFQSCRAQTVPFSNSPLDLTRGNSLCVTGVDFEFPMRIVKNPVGVVDERNNSCAGKGRNSTRNSSSAKKATYNKVKEQEDTPPSSGKKEITFEFTDSEDERTTPGMTGPGLTRNSLYYSCKHCDYNDVNIDNVSAHYQNDHPFIRYNQVYIKDPSDESATFRCLNCPVEFLTLSDLRAHNAEHHPRSPNLFSIQSGDLAFKCFVCAFISSASEEVKTHYKEKHPTHEVDNALTFCSYWVDAHKEEQPQLNDCVKSQQCSPKTSPTSSKDVEVVPSDQHQLSPGTKNTTPADCVTTEEKSPHGTNNPYHNPEMLFYCQKCNYANVTAKGVLNHQVGTHRNLNICMEHVIEYTTKICDEMKHLQSQAEDSSFTCHLPLPRLQKGEENVFFCHLCNYRNDKMSFILKHYSGKHDQWKIESNQVEKHSSNIHKQIEDLRLRETTGQKIFLAGDKVTRKRTKKLSKGSGGSLKKRKESEESSDSDATDSPTPRSKRGKTRTLSCKACSYKCTSISAIAQHCRAVHPWSVKEDGSVLYLVNKRKSRTRRLQEDQTETTPSFESYQVPLEFESSPERAASPERIQCPFCRETFPTQHCANAHCLKMHQDGVANNSDAQMEEQLITSFAHPGKIQSPLHVFKCPYCTYVNSTRPGVFTHSSTNHSGLALTTESCHLQMENMLNVERLLQRKGLSLTLCGYMCKNCPQIYANQTELSQHCQKVHCETTAESQPVPRSSTLAKKKHCHSKQKSQSKASSLNRKRIQCQRCSYRCTQKRLLAEHVKVCHKTESASEALDCPHKCALCPSVYSQRNLLGKHYILTHGTKFFFKYSNVTAAKAAAELSVNQKNNSEAGDSTNTSEDHTISVYQCPECPYFNATAYGFSMHCQKKHPSLLARVKESQKKETILANFDRLKISNPARGYKCKKCLHIFYSMTELKSHLKRDHTRHKDGTLASDRPEVDPILSPPPPPQQDDDSLHKCKLCPYIGLKQKYLFDHYRNKHKLDLATRHKLLKNDAADKHSQAALSNESDEVSNVEGEPCDPEFQLTEQLISRYSLARLSVSALDFIELAKPSNKSSGLYKCSICREHVMGAKSLCSHLVEHRESVRKAAVDPTDDVTPWHDKLPELETVGDLAQSNVTPMGTLDVSQSPPPSPASPPTLERMEPAPEEEGLACKQCNRKFKYQNCLASHGRSHAAVAAIRKRTIMSTSTLKHSINKYILYKAGNRKPFLCTLCRYCTTIMSLLRRHLVKRHESIVKGFDVADSKESSQNSENKAASPIKTLSGPPEHLEGLQTSEGLSYSEAPDVQRQLDHYNKMAQASNVSEPTAQEDASPATCLLQCELCSYGTGRLPTLRRHYSTRHRKKMRTCKGCSHVTCSKKSMKEHSDVSHGSSRRLPAAAGKGDLSCPFCLYQTKSKNYMIDHIVLHREERVVPIEPCRPQLSRYLQGIILRCHKCTFTSGSAESLRLHMMKHDDIKPYKCLLCYFGCTQLSDLEAHLSDKHQVLRNHELVGQIRLDELEARLDRTSQEEGDPLSHTGTVTDCDKASSKTQTNNLVEIKTDEEHLQMDLEQEDRQQAAGEDVKDVNHQSEKKDIQIQDNQVELKPRNGDGKSIRNSSLKEEIAKSYMGSPDKRPGLPQKRRTFNDNDAKIEEHILRCVLQLEKDGSTVKMRKRSEMDLPSKAEMKMEAALAHSHLREYLLFNNWSNNLKNQDGTEVASTASKTSPAKPNCAGIPNHFTLKRHSLTHGVHNGQHKFGPVVVPFTASSDKEMENPGRSEKVEDSCSKNEALTEEGRLASCCDEEDQGVDEVTHQKKKPRLEDGATEKAESPRDPEGAITNMDGQATSVACDFCGRRLANSCQLERHIVQHGK